MSVAVVLLAHDKPRLLRRIVGALDGLPVFLHIDARINAKQHAELIRDLPDRVRLLPRLASGWATFELVEAELAGYRAACESTDAEHFVMMTGADYPLVSVDRLVDRLGGLRGVSWADVTRLPIRVWGPMGGYDRFIFGNRVRDGKRVWSFVPRRWPKGVRPAGGSQLKILARRHVETLLELVDTRPQVVEYFHHVWIPDEVMLPSLLCSPDFGMNWPESHVRGGHAWHIDWGDQPGPHPRILGLEDLSALRASRTRDTAPALFARKFTEDSWPILDLIERELWRLP